MPHYLIFYQGFLIRQGGSQTSTNISLDAAYKQNQIECFKTEKSYNENGLYHFYFTKFLYILRLSLA